MYLLRVTALQKDEVLLPFGDRFLDEIFVQNFKWRMSQRGADLSYIFDTNYFTVSQKLAELYSSAYFYALLFAVEIPPQPMYA